MLTPCQTKTLEAFKKFLRSEPGVFTIAGDAGSGKSIPNKINKATIRLLTI